VWELDDTVTATRIAEAVSRGDLDAATANQIARKEYRTEYRQAVVQAADDDVVNAEQIGSVVQRTEFLEQTKAANARQLISVAGSQGIKLIDDLDDAALRQLTDFQPGAADASRLERVIDTVEGLEDTRQTRALQLISDASDGAGIKLIDDIDQDSLNRLLDYDGAAQAGMRAELADQYNADSINIDQIEQFSRNLEDLRGEVDGVESVIADDIAGGGPTNVKGALYEFRVANEYVGSIQNVRQIGRTFDLPDLNDLSDSQIDQLIEELDFRDATDRADKVATIEDALTEGELDVVLTDGKYLEAKSTTDTVEYPDLLAKSIKYKTLQLTDDIGPNSEIEVVAPDGAFTTKSGNPNKPARFIENSDGITKGNLESLADSTSSSIRLVASHTFRNQAAQSITG